MALEGLKVLDLSRILAGPTCTQLLGDLGADVLKIENPVTQGDDTRSWGPPYAEGQDGEATDLSAYFICANRNKRSVAVDIATPEGQETIRKLAAKADIVIENFKPGGLKKYSLDYACLKEVNPEVIYCSISGYGQTGPNSSKPGYDLMAQGFGGVMSLTGAPDGEPMKVGVGIADVMCGMYATVGILAALRHRDQTGEGQHIDLSLVDSQIAWLINEGTNYLNSGQVPQRRGNGHPNIAPYQVYETAGDHVIVACGNDTQFQRLCQFLGLDDLASDPRFASNPARIENREALNAVLEPAFGALSAAQVVAGLEERAVPVGSVNRVDQVFETEQVAAREMMVQQMHGATGALVKMIGNPLKFSQTPIAYRRPPPSFGEHTDEVLEKDPWD